MADPAKLRATLAPVDSMQPKGVGGRKMTIRTAAAKQRAIMHEVDKGAGCTSCDTCPGFELHFWRKRCKNCLCAREDHDVDVVPGTCRPTRKLIGDEDSQADETDNNGGDVGDVGDVGDSEPKEKVLSIEDRKRLAHQDPEHDHNPDQCSSLDGENQIKSFQRLDNKRNEMYGIGEDKTIMEPEEPPRFCHRSGEQIKTGDEVVECTLSGKDVVYLKDNFTCFNCNCKLFENRYYEYENEVYCGRCHAEKFMPRCAGCDELIFDPTYTVAEGKKWHVVHFCCWVCDIDLCEKQYAKDSDGNPCCLPCYNDKYAVTCGTCEKLITAGERAMRAGDQSYHDSDDCFRCKVCSTALKDKKCVQYQGGLYCSPCYHDVHSPPCGRCGERVRGEFVEVRGVRYKKSCFNCYDCGVPFTREEKKGAYPIGDRLLCYNHALETRRKELREAKAKEAATKAAENLEAQQSKLAPKITISDEQVDAKEGGEEVVAGPAQNMVRSGTKRVSRIARKPSKRAVTKPDQNDDAARQKKLEEAQATAAARAAAEAEAAEAEKPRRQSTEQVEEVKDDEIAEPAMEEAKEEEARAISPEKGKSPEPEDPFAELWAGFVIPLKMSKFQLNRRGREALDIQGFTLVTKHVKAQVYLVLCTDIAMLVQKVEEGCYELMFMPVERNKVKAKIVKSPENAMEVKVGKKVVLKARDEIARSEWLGKLNAPVGFVPTKKLDTLPIDDSADLF